MQQWLKANRIKTIYIDWLRNCKARLNVPAHPFGDKSSEKYG
jgi:DNA primase